MKVRSLLLGQLLAGSCLIAPCYAQTAAPAGATQTAPTSSPPPADEGTQLGEVVVTAQRTAQSLQRVPVAVTAVSASDLVTRGVGDTQSLSAVVPNLSMNKTGVVVTPYLRGVGSSASNPNDEQSVATYIDGVYIASPTGNIFSFNNIARIEVLKGPQGTLFGRNATGGVIQVVTRDPKSTPSLEAQAGIGDYATVQGSLYATTGLLPNLAGDIAVAYQKNFEGYGRDLVRDEDIMKRQDFAVRSKLLWTPASKTEVRLSADYSQVRSTGTDYQLVQGVVGVDGVSTYPGAFKTTTNWPNRANNEIYGVSLTLNQDLDFVRFVSITAYRHLTGLYSLDQDATAAPIVNGVLSQYARTLSQEVQLLSPTAAKVQWLLGVYYFDAEYRYDPLTVGGLAAAPLPALNIFNTQNTNSISGYGQATVEVLPKTKLTGGLRYTDERQNEQGVIQGAGLTLAAPPELRQSFDKLTFRVALDHQFTDAILGYTSFNRGIKSGGFNLLSPGTPGYRPEILDAYEGGIKTEFFDKTLRVNAAAFYYDYTDIQVQVIQTGAVSTLNAASAHLKGFDADVAWLPVRNLTLSGGVGYVYGKYVSFPNAVFTPASPLLGPQTQGSANDNDVVNAPRFTTNASASYKMPSHVGDFLLTGVISYRDKSYVTADNRLAIPSYTLVNTTLGWTSLDGRYGAQLYVKNLFDETWYASRVEQSLGDLQYRGAPRTFGVLFNVKL